MTTKVERLKAALKEALKEEEGLRWHQVELETAEEERHLQVLGEEQLELSKMHADFRN